MHACMSFVVGISQEVMSFIFSTHGHPRTCENAHTHIYTHKHTRTQANMHTCTLKHIHTCILAHMHTHTGLGRPKISINCCICACGSAG